MKRIIIVVLSLLQVIVLMFPLSKTQLVAPPLLVWMPDSPNQLRSGEAENTGAFFQLPLSLEYIGNEAFEGVASSGATESLAQDSCSESSIVLTVCIPVTVSFISDDAFPSVEAVQIVAPRESYAQRWAQEQGYRCVEERSAAALCSDLLQILQIVLCFCMLFCVLPPDPQKYRREASFVYNSIGRDPKEWPGMRVLELDYP